MKFTTRRSVAQILRASATLTITGILGIGITGAAQTRMHARDGHNPDALREALDATVNPDDVRPFTFGDVEFANQAAYIRSGRRCSTDSDPGLIQAREADFRARTKDAGRVASGIERRSD